MTTAPDFRLVDEHVARNPVAQAIAKSQLTIATRDFQTRLYLLQDGEDVTGDVMASSKVLAVAQAVTAGSLVEADRLIKGQTQAQAAALVQSARPGPSVLPAGQGVPAAQGIDVSQFKGPRALEGLEKHIKGMQRLGQM